MEERNARCAQRELVIAILLAHVDDRPNGMRVGEIPDRVGSEASSHGNIIRDPAQIQITEIC